MTQILWVISILALAYAGLMLACDRNPDFAAKMPRFLRPFHSNRKSKDSDTVTTPANL